MYLATAVVSTLLAALMSYAAARKLTHRPEVVESYLRAGVPEYRLDLLAIVLFAGAAGLLAGLVWAPIGIGAAAATLVYFVVAVGFHVRAGDAANLPTPLALAIMAAAAAALQLARL
jgi:DoxX-like family